MIRDNDIVCPKCGTWRDQEDYGDHVIAKCPKCGYSNVIWSGD